MPSTSAKINFLLGLEERSDFEACLGKHLNANFRECFLGLVKKSTGVKQPIPLFTFFTEEQVKRWREKFRGKN
jgi:hypothetical protein